MVTEHTVSEKDQDHINLVILSDASMPDRTGAILAGQYDAPYNQLLEDARTLEKLGCEAIAITCNKSNPMQTLARMVIAFAGKEYNNACNENFSVLESLGGCL